MTRRYFLGLLSLIGCAKEEIRMNKMQIVNMWGSGGATADTTSDGKQIFASIGHSISLGYTAGDGTHGEAPSAGTVYEFTNSYTEAEVGSSDLSTANSCSQWPKFGKDYNAATGKKPVICNYAVTNSRFYHSSNANLDWSSGGNLRAAAKTKIDNCLSHYGLTKLKGFHIDLGVNDSVSAETIGTVLSSITDLIDWVQTNWGSDIPIYINLPGPSGLTTTARYGQVGWKIWDLPATYTNVHIVGNEHTIILSWGLTSENLHPNKAGYDKKGEILARYVVSTETSRHVRRVIANHYTLPSATTRAAIKTFIDGEVSAGRWALRDGFQPYVSAVAKNNALMDWIGITSPRDPIGIEWNAGNLRANGSTTYIDSFDRVGHLGRNLTLNDAFHTLHAGVNLTSAGTLASAFGSNSPFSRLYQSASSDVRYGMNAATDRTYSGLTKIGDNKVHTVKRTASNATAYFVDGSSVDTGTQVSTSIPVLSTYVGARNQNNTSVFEFCNLELKLYEWGLNTGFDVAAARTAEQTLLTQLAID